jgi:hypothetical protein
MSADAFRLFAFARHAESEANAAHVLSSDPARPVALTAGDTSLWAGDVRVVESAPGQNHRRRR